MTEWLHFHFSLSCVGEGNGNPLQCSCLENPRDGGAWWAAVMGSHRVGHDWSDLAAAVWPLVLLLFHYFPPCFFHPFCFSLDSTFKTSLESVLFLYHKHLAQLITLSFSFNASFFGFVDYFPYCFSPSASIAILYLSVFQVLLYSISKCCHAPGLCANAHSKGWVPSSTWINSVSCLSPLCSYA